MATETTNETTVMDPKQTAEGETTKTTSPTEKAPDSGAATPVEEPKKDEPGSVSPPKRFKVKLDGNEMEVDEEDLVKGYQIEQVSRKRLSDAAQLAKEAQDILQTIDKDPKGAILHRLAKIHGSKEAAIKAYRDMAVEAIKEMAAEEEMTEEDRRGVRMRLELEEREARVRMEEETVQKRRIDEAAAGLQAQIEQDLGASLQKAGLPTDDPIIQAQALEYWMFAEQNGLSLTWDQIAREVTKSRRRLGEELAKSFTESEFEATFKPHIEARDKKRLESLRQGATSQGSTRQGEPQAASQGRKPKKAGEFRSMSEYRKYMDEVYTEKP